MDWTDRHCRYFHRLLSRHALLYTEMVNAGAVLHGGTDRHLRFDAQEQPVALTLGGCEPGDLARAARLGEAWGCLLYTSDAADAPLCVDLGGRRLL